MNQEKHRLYQIAWREKNRQRCRDVRRRWKQNNPEKARESWRKYVVKNAAKRRLYMQQYGAATAEHKAQLQRDRLAKYKRLVVDAYGGCCNCCGENELVFLTVEHTRRNGKTHRKPGENFYMRLISLRFPQDEGLSILCMNCNWAMRNGFKCPHQKFLLQVFA